MERPPILVDVPERIETRRLVLRMPRAGDGAAVNAAIRESFDTLHQWMPWARELPSVDVTEAKMREYNAAFVARESLPILMFARDDDSFVGGGSLHAIEWSIPRFEIGYWVRSTCEGKGYVSETVEALATLAFASLGAVRVEIHCSHRNLRSQRVAERCGFVLEARLRDHSREPDGTLRDTMIYARVRPAA